jgi:hypothetical protein
MEMIRQIPREFRLAIRRLGLVVALLLAVWAVLEFSRGRPGNGAYTLAFAALLLLLDFRARRREMIFAKIPSEFQFYEVYGFFGALIFLGIAALVLAILNVVGIVVGITGSVVAVASVYAIVREAQSARRKR